MTPDKEDSLKAIDKPGSLENLVSNKQIADALQIAPASVTEMLGKMKKGELIHYEPYKGARLTPEGMQAAISLMRGHRLWEAFLMRHLGYSWSEAHEDAELLEYITPKLSSCKRDFPYPPGYKRKGTAGLSSEKGIEIGSSACIVEKSAYERSFMLDLGGKCVYKASCQIYTD